ncbi:MAG: hypothetical protein L6437_02160 [Kiritimatiellae bacterium]|nr:hypothetical protein [Kiritimatiellia bacterium]
MNESGGIRHVDIRRIAPVCAGYGSLFIQQAALCRITLDNRRICRILPDTIMGATS